MQHVEPSQAFTSLIDLYEQDVMSVARAMPADKYDFTPASLTIPTADFSGVRSFAEQVRHLAEANYAIFSEAGGLPTDRDAKSLKALHTKAELVQALADSIEFARKAVQRLSPENATLVIPGPQLATRETMAAHGIAHGYDHYGQMVEYLRMNGITPPSSSK